MITVDKNCTGCGACAQICPAHCIELYEDDTGFPYPRVNKDRCLNCGACAKACHLNLKAAPTEQRMQAAYAVKSRSDAVLRKSTSGGAFSELAEYVFNQDGIVYGCAYTDHLQAKHIRVDKRTELARLNGSKYLQSDIGSTFEQVREDLKKSRLVLFSGTPCQVAALNGFIGRKPDNLLTVDIVCHGVASQRFFDKYIEWYEKKHACRLDDYSFRSKENSGWSLAGTCSGQCVHSKHPFKKKIYYYDEFYYFYFLKGLAYRESCYSCRYANLNRPGDISLGDMWGVERLDLGFDTEDGCSLLITNTQKGSEAFHKLALASKQIAIEQAVKHNKQLSCPSEKPVNYDEIIRFIETARAEQIDKDFKKRYRSERVKGFLKYHIPRVVIRVVKRKL